MRRADRKVQALADLHNRYRRAVKVRKRGRSNAGAGIVGYFHPRRGASPAAFERRREDKANPRGARRRKLPGRGGKRRAGRRWEGGS